MTDGKLAGLFREVHSKIGHWEYHDGGKRAGGPPWNGMTMMDPRMSPDAGTPARAFEGGCPAALVPRAALRAPGPFFRASGAPHPVDGRILEKLEQKILETASAAAEVRRLAGELGSDPRPIALGIAAGRLYNSFHYQTRRVLGRAPTAAEFEEFAALLRSRGSELGRGLFPL